MSITCVMTRSLKRSIDSIFEKCLKIVPREEYTGVEFLYQDDTFFLFQDDSAFLI